MDLTYATIPMFGGETKRLYRENQLAYIISKESNSMNHWIYIVPNMNAMVADGNKIEKVGKCHKVKLQLQNYNLAS